MPHGAGGPREARYANHFEIGFNESEFVIDFAQVYDDEPALFHTRIVTSPSHARDLASLIRDALDGDLSAQE